MADTVQELLQAQILGQLNELRQKVELGLDQGRVNGEEVRLLRKELGVDGPHGRLPAIESLIERHESRLSSLEVEKRESEGRQKFFKAIVALCGGGAGGAIIALIGRLFWRH